MKGKFKGKQRGKQSGNKGGNRGNKGNKKQKFKPQRKTYSLHNSKNDGGFSKKRKFGDNKEKDYETKRPRNDEIEKPEEKVVSESSSEEEVDDMQQLLGTFKGVKPRTAIDSSSEESEEEDEIESNEQLKDIDQEEEEDSDVSNMASDSEHDDLSDLTDEQQEELSELEQNVKEGHESAEKADEDVDDDEEIEIQLLEDHSTETKIEMQNDPFVKHCLFDINESLLNSVQNVPPLLDNTKATWSELGTLLIQIPKCIETIEIDNENLIQIEEKKVFASGAKVPVKISQSKSTLQDLFIKPQILKNIQKANTTMHSTTSDSELPLTQLQTEVFSILNNYQDLYFPQRTFENGEELRFVYCLHAMNHVIKTRLKVINHNSRLTNKDDVSEEFRDQGLVRPKVLIILPFRDAAYKVINMLIDILFDEDKGNVMNKNRFVDEFTGSELIMPKKNPKPEDYELLFCGNSNDDFKIGITITKKSMKLYADFYSSDIIIASPLGLRPIIGAEGEPERDYDFLASIELLILDQTEIFLMQNWDHLLHIFKHLHMQPKESHGTDFARVRTWSLNGWAKYYRQTILLSSLQVPEINSIFNKQCCNYAGKVKVVNPIAFGSIRQVFVQVPHVYHKFNATNSAEAIDARFDFFINKILPQQKDTSMKHTLIYVANYFDYVRLRNYFKKEDIGFVQICEYSKDNKIARARDMFFHGDAHFLLYTERYHFFNRKRIKGIRQLIFYQPPYFPHFYYEMCNLMQEANMNKKLGSVSNMTVNVIYSKYDIQQLSAIVGTERAIKMVQSDRSVHMLLTD